MLLTRVITALILAPLVIAAVWKLPYPYFAAIWAVIILIGAWEWSNLAGLTRLVSRILFTLSVIAGMAVYWFWIDLFQWISTLIDMPELLDHVGIVDWLAIPAVFWWLFIATRLKSTPEQLLQSKPSMKFKWFVGWLILVTAWIFLARLKAFYPWQIVLYPLLLIWLADIAAYFGGRKYGTTKLTPISPGKTVAGMYSALIATLLFAIGWVFYFDYNTISFIDFIMLSMITVSLSISGDLFISLAKRLRGVKDSGTILPGHGGILDRIDSLLAAIPIFFTGVMIMMGEMQ